LSAEMNAHKFEFTKEAPVEEPGSNLEPFLTEEPDSNLEKLLID
jgi:hypothetical protein